MVDLDELRAAMLAQVRERAGPISPAVAGALLAVPRHLFVPDVGVAEAYLDDAIVTKRDRTGRPVSSSSQPTIMALMLDQLAVEPGQRVLEIGAGTGYNAALLAHLVGGGGAVASVDIDADLVWRAASAVRRAGYPDVRMACADGADGYPGLAPYDRIIATVGVWDLAPAWLDQLAPGGRLVVPLDLRGVHRSVAFQRAGAGADHGHLVSTSVVPCGFIRMRGALAGPEQLRVLDGSLSIMVPGDGAVDAPALTRSLAGPATRHPIGVAVSARDGADGLSLWFAVHEPRWCVVSEPAGPASRLAAAPTRIRDTLVSAGIVDGASVAILVKGDAGLDVCGYGPDGGRLAADLAGLVRAWDAAGRPATDGLRVDAYHRSTPDSELVAGTVIDKRYTRLVLSWPDAAP